MMRKFSTEDVFSFEWKWQKLLHWDLLWLLHAGEFNLRSFEFWPQPGLWSPPSIQSRSENGFSHSLTIIRDPGVETERELRSVPTVEQYAFMDNTSAQPKVKLSYCTAVS
jgi:hypothetical protein